MDGQNPRLIPVTSIPPKRRNPRKGIEYDNTHHPLRDDDLLQSIKGKDGTKNKRTASPLSLLREFRDGDDDYAEVSYLPDTYDAIMLVSSLNSCIKQTGFPGIRVHRRGWRVYLSKATAAPVEVYRPDGLAIESELWAFDRDVSEGTLTTTLLPWPVGCDNGAAQRTLYAAYHYRRTSLGLGDVRVSMERDGIRLTDTMRSV